MADTQAETAETRPSREDWAAFLLSSALIIGTFLPIINYGFVFPNLLAVIMFGCDGAQTRGDCLVILLSPFIPPCLTVIALVVCQICIGLRRHLASIAVAAAACGVSWGVFLRAFGS